MVQALVKVGSCIGFSGSIIHSSNENFRFFVSVQGSALAPGVRISFKSIVKVSGGHLWMLLSFQNKDLKRVVWLR
jgi:hypothetical protein